jgi:GNAT superfamily N-acetyltransferase
MTVCTGVNGSDAVCLIEDLANLRCRVFREYPYLYAGDLDYEREYLAHYTKADSAYLVIAKSEGRIVGVSTCMPLTEADPAFRQPFMVAGYNPDQIAYFGESVLLPEFRGQGVGHRFFDLRESWAKDHHFEYNAFCSVIRSEDHPARPLHYRSNDSFWMKRGYRRHDELIAHLDWPEISSSHHKPETCHQLVFWLKCLS